MSAFPPPPNETARSESMQFNDESTELLSSGDSQHIIVQSRPSVMDMADAFQKMEDNIKNKSKNRKIQSPKKYPKLAMDRNKNSTSNDASNESSDERSDILMHKLREFNDRKQHKNSITKLKDSLRRKSDEIQDLQSLVKEQQKSFKNRFKTFKQKDDKIKRISTEMRTKTQEKNAEIRRLSAQYQNKEKHFTKKIKHFQEQIENKEKHFRKTIEKYELKIDRLSNEKRLENHVLNIANENDLKTEIQTLKTELSKLKGQKVSDIIKIEKYSMLSQRLQKELNDERNNYSVSKLVSIKAQMKSQKQCLEQTKGDLKFQINDIFQQFTKEVSTFAETQSHKRIQIQKTVTTPKRKSVFEEAVGSLNSLFDGISHSMPKSNLTKQLEQSPMKRGHSVEVPSIKHIKEDNRHSEHQTEQIHYLNERLHEKEDDLRSKEEMLSRLSEENKHFKQQIFDLRDQLHYQEQFNEMNESQHQIQRLLETLHCERKQHNQHLLLLEHRLSQIMEQNNELRQSIQPQSGSIDEDMHTTESGNRVHAIPISMRAMRSQRFSEIFLQQLQSPESTNDTNAILDKYSEDT